MKFQYCSDLHLEFKTNRKYLERNPIIPSAEVLLLAGDIMNLHRIDQGMDFLKYCSDNWKQTYWIAGNHEWYGSDIKKYVPGFREDILSNVTFLNNWVEQVEDVDLIFTTLWSFIPPERAEIVGSIMNDYRLIKYGEELLTPWHTRAFYADARQTLNLYERYERAKGRKSVVVTHHLPTFSKYPEEYRSSSINQAFATDMNEYIEEAGHEAWVFGHHHRNVDEFKIGKTRMLTNQLGYIDKREFLLFDPAKTFEV
jgi:Icc-related predicted phosphoesterase